MNRICIITSLLLSLFLGQSIAFSVVGNQLIDENGNPTLLRGLARPSLEWNSVGEHLSLSDYQLIHGWGANCVRLSLNQGFYLSTHTGYDPNYASTIDQQVTWIKSLGMAVILDLHWSDQGNLNGNCAQQNMADVNSLTFWSQLARKYANDTKVIYELYNEPHDVTWSDWLNGGTSAGYTTVGMQQLYNTVRGTGATNVVIVNGLSYAFDLSGVANYPVNGYNIVYGTHPYDYSGKQVSDYDAAFGYLAPTHALIATEFGEYSCTPTYVSNFIAYANQKSMSWTAWAWYVNGCSFPSAISDWNGTPSADGAVVKTDLTCTNKVPGNTTSNGAPGCASSTGSTSSSATSSSSSSPSSSSASASGSSNGSSDVLPRQDLVIYDDSLHVFSDYSWSKTKNPADSTQKHSGSVSYSFQPQNYEAVYFEKTSAIDTNEFKGIEFWIYVTSTSVRLAFNIVDNGSTATKIGNSIDISSGLTANTWTYKYIDLSQFPTGVYDGFWFQDQANSPTGTVYLDDVKIYANTAASSTTGSGSATGVTATATATITGTVVSPTSAPLPTAVIFNGSVQGMSDKSWAQVSNSDDSSVKLNNVPSYSFQPQKNQAVFFQKTGAVDTRAYSGVEFYYYPTAKVQVSFAVVQQNTSSNNNAQKRAAAPGTSQYVVVGPNKDVSYWASVSSLPLNTWTKIAVDFSQFPSGKYDGFWFQDESGVAASNNTVYLNSIKLLAGRQTTNATSDDPSFLKSGASAVHCSFVAVVLVLSSLLFV